MEELKLFLEYASIICALIMIVDVSTISLTYFQEAHYHFASFKKIAKNFYTKEYRNLLFIAFIPLLFFMDRIVPQIIFIVLGIIYLSIRKKKIIKLKLTGRVMREFLMIVLVNTVFLTLLFMVLPLKELASGLIIALILQIPLILLSSYLIFPLEYLIFIIYQKKCQRKLDKINPIKIAITGSYGKTSTKKILYEVLKRDYHVFATPKSYNTLNGIAKCVNEDMDKDTNLAIFEFGASQINDIDKLCDLVKPQYAIITSIGPQHLESFHTMENIVNEKMKLARRINDGFAVLNWDNEYIRKNQKDVKKKITVGARENAQFRAQNIAYNQFGLKFQIISQKEKYEIVSPLLGRHQVTNILLAVAMAEKLGVKKETIEMAISQYDGDNNRLKYHEMMGEMVLDDSFNCNIEGFHNALEILNMDDRYKVLLTPGIVEGGEEEKKLNEEIAMFIKATCDMVILVKNQASNYIYNKLIEESFDNVIMVNSFKEGFNLYKELKQEKILLIENDISDIYKI